MATVDRQNRIQRILAAINPLNEENRQQFSEGFQKDYSLGREDTQQAFYRKRDLQKKQKEAPRAESMFSTHPGMTRLREAMGFISDEHRQALKERDMHLETDAPFMKQAGQFVGTAAADITQDATRSIHWLMNAPQAAGDVLNEVVLSKVAPELWDQTDVLRDVTVKTKGGKQTSQRKVYKGVERDVDYAYDNGFMNSETGDPKRGYKWAKDDKGDEVLQQRNYSPGMIAALSIPTGIAINNGLGLLTPFGGAEGFKATNPTPDDPTKTNNVVAEVAQKYILGRTGGLLPYNEFKQVRPDVSLGEYKAYQADKFDNSEDLNPFDGDFSVLGGFVKGNVEGIMGPEVSMFGRSMPLTTGLIPGAFAIAGTAAGARYGHRHRGGKGAQTGLMGGLAGVAVGTAAGSIIENERRRRNGIDNGELPLQ